jgi:hypothetical protein
MAKEAMEQIKAHTPVTLNDNYFGDVPAPGPAKPATPGK